MAKPALLYASPLPPAQSGIAVYSDWMITALAAHFDITLYTHANNLPEGRLKEFPVLIHGSDLRRVSKFDHRLYQIGNNPWHHGFIYEACLANPGWVVMHEFVLYFLVAGLYRDRPDFYQRLFK